jgi:hypothetical protein
MELIFTTDEKLREIVSQAISGNPLLAKRDIIETATVNKGYDDQITSMIGLAQFLKCSVVTAQDLKNSGKIRYRQFGRKVIFLKSEIMEDLEKISFRAKRNR